MQEYKYKPPGSLKRVEVESVLVDDIKGAKRLMNESFEDYKKRMKREQKLLKNHLRGSIRWNSRRKGSLRINDLLKKGIK